MYREISHLKDSNEAKAAEASNQQDKLKQLEYENNRTLARIADTQKLVDVRSHDLRTKQLALEDTEAELARLGAAHDEFACYDVEVCTACRFHHLLRKFPAGGVKPRRSRKAAT